MQQPRTSSSTPLRPGQIALRLGAIGAVVVVAGAAFGYAGGWLDPQRLTPDRIVDSLEQHGEPHPGYRRNHAKGICVIGEFDSSGAAQVLSTASVFAKGRTPVVGRLALPGGNPYAPDSSVPIRSFALRFTSPDGQQWRTGMNSMPVFAVGTPEGFYDQQVATLPDPKTGKPDPAKVKAFFAAHPETANFLAWVKTAKPSASFATETYYGLDAFLFVNSQGKQQAVRWRVVPVDAADAPPAGPDHDQNYLDADLAQRLAKGPLRWRLLVTVGAPGDPTNDATKPWPADRPEVDAGTVVIQRADSQEEGECRDVNYDPTVLPSGIAISDDPLLPARSAAYASSYERRTSEGPPARAAQTTPSSNPTERKQ
jgi:catalase